MHAIALRAGLDKGFQQERSATPLTRCRQSPIRHRRYCYGPAMCCEHKFHEIFTGCERSGSRWPR